MWYRKFVWHILYYWSRQYKKTVLLWNTCNIHDHKTTDYQFKNRWSMIEAVRQTLGHILSERWARINPIINEHKPCNITVENGKSRWKSFNNIRSGYSQVKSSFLKVVCNFFMSFNTFNDTSLALEGRTWTTPAERPRVFIVVVTSTSPFWWQ